MLFGFTPTATRLRTMPRTTSGEEQMIGAPEQFTLIPTMSAGEKKLAHASRSAFAPVSDCIPLDSILSTVAWSTCPDGTSITLSDWTRATIPGYGPGREFLVAE